MARARVLYGNHVIQACVAQTKCGPKCDVKLAHRRKRNRISTRALEPRDPEEKEPPDFVASHLYGVCGESCPPHPDGRGSELLERWLPHATADAMAACAAL
jgi:hypothetical protein